MKRHEIALTYAFTCLFGAAIGYKVGHLTSFLPKPALSNDRIIASGQKYKQELGAAYAAAWKLGADKLDAGTPIGETFVEVGREWQAGRDRAYADAIASKLNEFIPEGTPDKEVTTTQKAKLAEAFRKFAQGLTQ